MKLSQFLTLLGEIADKKGLSQPFVCGGTPRDKLLGKLSDVKDLDITTGDEGSHHLAKEVSQIFKEKNSSYKIMEDGHAQVMIGAFKADFSSNYRAPDIKNILTSAGIKNPTEMQMELYSRDFTCNTLLLSLDLKKVLDPTGTGVKGINSRVLKTCLPPEITLGGDHKRIIRIIYLSSKLNFEVDEPIIAWVKENPQFIADAKNRYIVNKLKLALSYNKENTIMLLDKMNLWGHIPIIEELSPYMSKNVARI